MPSPEIRKLRRTVNKIDKLRLRVQETRSSNTKCLPIDDTLDRDVILKALELLRETITAAHALTEQNK
jgi:hypothetical protein